MIRQGILTISLFLVTHALFGQLVTKPECDSLLPSLPVFNVNESITFTAKMKKTRMVGTVSCSCNNTDFYYRVFTFKNNKWELYLDHYEYPAKNIMCDCKVQYASFENGKTYAIPQIKEPGEYYVEIQWLDFLITSRPFKTFSHVLMNKH